MDRNRSPRPCRKILPFLVLLPITHTYMERSCNLSKGFSPKINRILRLENFRPRNTRLKTVSVVSFYAIINPNDLRNSGTV